MEVDGERFALFTLPDAPDAPELPSDLTATEREVALAMLMQLSNAEIAARMGRSVRTIANHVAAVLRKSGSVSRKAFAAGATR